MLLAGSWQQASSMAQRCYGKGPGERTTESALQLFGGLRRVGAIKCRKSARSE